MDEALMKFLNWFDTLSWGGSCSLSKQMQRLEQSADRENIWTAKIGHHN